MHGQGTLRLRGGNVYLGGFENDKKHGLGYLPDYGTCHKVREEWVRGKQSAGSSVRQASTKEELDAHLKKEGYYYQNQASGMRKTTLADTSS